MNEQPLDPITDELLSAYIDGDATEAEQQRVEYAIANDPDVAWQVETLRQTVALLRNLPAVPLNRSFVIEEDQVADILALRRDRSPAASRAQDRSVWKRLFDFLNAGNLVLRNMSAVAAALFLVVTVGRAALFGPTMLPMAGGPPDVASMEAPAQLNEAAPAEYNASETTAADSAGAESASTMRMESAAAEPAADEEAVEAAMEAAEPEVASIQAAPPVDSSLTDPTSALKADDASARTLAPVPSAAPPSTAQDSSVTTFTIQPETAAAPASESMMAEERGSEDAAMASVPAESSDAGPASEGQVEDVVAALYDLATALFETAGAPVAVAPASEAPAGDAPASDAPAVAPLEESAAPASAEAVESAAASSLPEATESPSPIPTPVLDAQQDEDYPPPASEPAILRIIPAEPGSASESTSAQDASEPSAGAVAMDSTEDAERPVLQPASSEETAVERSARSSTSTPVWDVWLLAQVTALVLALGFFVLWLLSRKRRPIQ